MGRSGAAARRDGRCDTNVLLALRARLAPSPTSTSSMQGEGLTPAQPQGRRVVGDGGGALGSMFLFLCARPPLPDAPPARRSARAPRQADHHLVVEEG